MKKKTNVKYKNYSSITAYILYSLNNRATFESRRNIKIFTSINVFQIFVEYISTNYSLNV